MYLLPLPQHRRLMLLRLPLPYMIRMQGRRCRKIGHPRISFRPSNEMQVYALIRRHPALTYAGKQRTQMTIGSPGVSGVDQA